MKQAPELSPGRASTLLWRVAGLLSLALAILGIVLPLLPTTPFLLLSAYCFGRGSEHLQKWLLEHPHLGPPIRDWRQNRSISRRAKGLAALAMILLVLMTLRLGAPDSVLILQLVVVSLVGFFVFTRPSSGR